MKKSCFLIACALGLVPALPGYGQISRGNWVLGTSLGSGSLTSSRDQNQYLSGSTSYSGTSQTTASTSFSFALNPQIGYFVADHLAIGGILSLEISSSQSNQTSSAGSGIPSDISRSNSYSFTAGPFIRYYFGDPVLSSTLFFIQADARGGTGDGNSTVTSYRTTYISNSTGQGSGGFYWNAAGELGLVHFISKSAGLMVYAGYGYTLTQGSQLTTTNYAYKGVNTGAPDAVDHHNYRNGSGEVLIGAGFNIYFNSRKKSFLSPKG